METSSSLSLAVVLALHVGGTRMSMSLGCCCAGERVPSREGDGEAGWGSPPHLQVSPAGAVVWDVSRKEEEREQVPRCLGDEGKRGNNTG